MSGGTAPELGPYDPYWTQDVRPWRRRDGWRRRVAFAAAAALALVGVVSMAPLRPPAEPGAAGLQASRPNEIVDLSAAPALALEGFAADAIRYESRADRAGSSRSDALSVGDLDGGGAALRAELWRDDGPRAAVSLFVAAAETAAAGGAAVERLGARQALSSASGPIEWAALALAGRGPRACAVFRLAARGGALRGVVCAASGELVHQASLACLIERLSLTKAGRDAGFGDVLKPGPARRALCRTPLG